MGKRMNEEQKEKGLTEETETLNTFILRLSRVSVLGFVLREVGVISSHRTHNLQEHVRPVHPHLLQLPLLIPRRLHVLELLQLPLPRLPGSHRILAPLLLDEVLLG